jgi:DNA-directed RNA polymerase subunit H (RpoH/RPB5)
VESLRGALYWKPDFDEFGHFAVKVVWALEVIDSDEARRVLAEAAREPGWLPWVRENIDDAVAAPRDPDNGYRSLV